MKKEKILFVLVRKDLRSKSQQAVQGGHALASYLLRYPDTWWNNGTLIYLSVGNEQELDSMVKILDKYNREYTYFNEPDLNGQRTAIAVIGEKGDFSNYKLMK